MDKFVENTEPDTCTGSRLFGEPGLVMDYYDGNTVTGLWNYAQHYAMSDNSFSTTFGPVHPGALNLVSGQTHGVIAVNPTGTGTRADRPPTRTRSPRRTPRASARSSTTRTRPTTTARTTTTPAPTPSPR